MRFCITVFSSGILAFWDIYNVRKKRCKTKLAWLPFSQRSLNVLIKTNIEDQHLFFFLCFSNVIATPLHQLFIATIYIREFVKTFVDIIIITSYYGSDKPLSMRRIFGIKILDSEKHGYRRCLFSTKYIRTSMIFL